MPAIHTHCASFKKCVSVCGLDWPKFPPQRAFAVKILNDCVCSTFRDPRTIMGSLPKDAPRLMYVILL